MLTVGVAPNDPVLDPRIRADGSIALEEEEDRLYRGAHKLTTAQSVDGKWKVIPDFQQAAEVVFTTERFLFTRPNWKRDSSGGSFFERRVMVPLLERGEGKQIAAGHLRHDWITHVTVAKPHGRFTKTSRIRLDFQREDASFSVSVEGWDPRTAEGLGERFTAAVARRRLEQHHNLDPSKRTVLEKLAAGTAEPQEVDWA